MKRYDPLCAPDAAEWLALDESTRIALVIDYHRRKKIALPNPKVHAVVHVTVENQLADNDPPNVRGTLERLMREGLDRHDAVHAIAMVVTEQMFDVVSKNKAPWSQKKHMRRLDALTAESYRAECDAVNEEMFDIPHADWIFGDDVKLDEEQVEDLMHEMIDEYYDDVLDELGVEDDEDDEDFLDDDLDFEEDDEDTHTP